MGARRRTTSPGRTPARAESAVRAAERSVAKMRGLSLSAWASRAGQAAAGRVRARRPGGCRPRRFARHWDATARLRDAIMERHAGGVPGPGGEAHGPRWRSCWGHGRGNHGHRAQFLATPGDGAADSSRFVRRWRSGGARQAMAEVLASHAHHMLDKMSQSQQRVNSLVQGRGHRMETKPDNQTRIHPSQAQHRR